MLSMGIACACKIYHYQFFYADERETTLIIQVEFAWLGGKSVFRSNLSHQGHNIVIGLLDKENVYKW